MRRIWADASGVALTEFAVVAPVFLTMGMYGAEVAYMATTKMKVSQIALSVADNASRLGQTDNSSVTPTITENDVEAVLSGALRQGQNIDLKKRGRVILTSLEFDDKTGRQFIHWQRCVGDKAAKSAYGDQNSNNGLTGTALPGMGRNATVFATSGNAVMFVEIFYDYKPLFRFAPGTSDAVFSEESAFLVRDDRDFQKSDVDGLSGTNKNTC